MRKKYFIAYYGQHNLWWDDDGKRFVPQGMYLYRSTWNNLDDVMKKVREVRTKYATGWADDICIDSELTV